MRALLAILVVLVAAGCGGGGSGEDAAPTEATTGRVAPRPKQDPEQFFQGLFGFYFDGRYDRAWGLLHPAHRAVVPRQRFEACLRRLLEGSGIELEDVEVLEAEEVPIDVPVVPEKQATAVTLRLTVTNAFGDVEQTTPTYNLVPVEGRWTWILEPEDVRAYQRGGCPR